uniref:Methyltransferase FkbM domain-containing protein n=1 Tax=Alexandrium andersonii TaxID=327968 RepID=A0A7S2C121_9DINO|mmetsp:Transcript_32482/g.74053  ORF Transcript_32482/g.74053 Transcript_32482/m.74053 type:complete len:314 (+) Transcript_32482:32-973(+)
MGLSRWASWCGSIVALVLAGIFVDPAHRVPPFFLGDLKKYDKGYQDFVLATQEALSSKRLFGTTVLHEVSGNEWLQGGLILDVGVFLGSSTRLLAKLLGNRTMVHGFDTFSGFPEGEWYLDDLKFPTSFQHSEYWVKGMISEHGLSFVNGMPSTMGHNITFHKGLVSDTLQPVLDAHPGTPVKFLHVDIDTYEGAKHTLEACRKRFVPGTIIAFDDFHVLNGEFKAFYEFQKEHSFQYTWNSWGNDIGYKNIISLKTFLCWMVGFNFINTRMFQVVMGIRWSTSFMDYIHMVFSFYNNAVSLHITDVGSLHDP